MDVNFVRRFFSTLLLTILCSVAAFALSPSEVFAKTKSKITAAKSLSADFTMSVNGQVVKGRIVSKGTKFALTSGAASSWYNGKDLYSYNPNSNETSIFRPTQSELAEVNPLLYLNSASDYKITGSKTKKTGVETMVLLPKKAGSGIKSVTIEVDSKSYLPKTIKIVPSSGVAMTLTVSNLKLNGQVNDNEFTYPSAKYPKATVNDLR